MQSSGLLATFALLLVGVGIAKYDTKARSASQAWLAIDVVAQVISIILASSLMSGGSSIGAGVGVVLSIVALGLAYAHATKLSNTSPLWNYLDGADIASWGAVVVSSAGLVGK